MTNTNELNRRIKESGLKRKFIAKKLEIAPYTLQLKIDNESEFKVSEVRKLCKLLNIGNEEIDDIFFAG